LRLKTEFAAHPLRLASVKANIMSPSVAAVVRHSLLFLVVATLTSCDYLSGSRQDSTTGVTPAAGDVKIRMSGGNEFRELLTRHQGKVVLVDYWATW
jgi:thiol:disulfide interchange protein